MEGLLLDDNGFLGIAEIFIRLDQTGSRMVEYPTVLESRLLGASKMKTLSVIRAHLGMVGRLLYSPKHLRRTKGEEAAGRIK